MKKRNIFIVLTIILSVCLCALTAIGCNGKSGPTTDGGNKEPEATLTLTRSSVQLVYGDSAVVVARYKDEDGKTLEWRSSDEAVATVDGGVITSVGLGSATITAKYGDEEATCRVSVTYDKFTPVLTVDNLGGELSLLKGESYELNAHVTFNGKNYDCDLSAEIADETVAAFENGNLKALKSGQTEVLLKGMWQNFDTSLMQKTVILTVTENDAATYITIEKDGETEVADELLLYVTDSFEGKNYTTAADVKFAVATGGKTEYGELSLAPNGDKIVTLDNGTVTAKSVGETTVNASYTSVGGTTYTKELNVKVVCPVEKYTAQVEWTDETIKDVTSYFADGAVVFSAKQGNKELQVLFKKRLTGVVFNGNATEPVEIQTSKGGYIFENIYGCNVLLTNENFVSTMTLTDKKNDKYYALSEDIGSSAAPVDMKDQKNASDTAAFGGTFDGRGHTVYAGVYENGIFGGYDSGAVVKNAEFVITFKTATANGMTSDRGRWARNPKIGATIENVHIITTNFGEKNHVMSELKVELLKMKDVLVEVNGAESLADFDGRDGVSVMFGIDISYYDLMMGNAGLEGFDNVRVVVDKLLPMANGEIWNGSKFITFAVNDEAEFGNVKRKSDNRNSVNYCMVTEVEKHSDWLKNIIFTNTPKVYNDCVFFCYASTKLENGGLYRYNTTADLKKAGIAQVGDWVVE